MILIIILIFAILIYLATGFYIFRKAFKRHNDHSRASISELKAPVWRQYTPPAELTLDWLSAHNAVDVNTVSFDGLRLCGKYVKNEDPRATIIVVHGYHGNYVDTFGLVFDFYYSLGFNILMIRQRAHGESEGKYITFGAHEHRDLLTWIDFHNRTYGELPLFISGISMGASTAMYIADKDLPGNVLAMSADCGFTSPYDIIRRVVTNRIKINSRFLMPAVNFWCRTLAHFDMKEHSSEKILPNAKVPILFIHGEDDDFVPCEMSRRGYNVCASKKRLVTVKGAGHAISYAIEKERLQKELADFFGESLNNS